MISLLLRFFGYAKVPPEAVQLIVAARHRWERRSDDPSIGTALMSLERLMRSVRATK